ncbi:unnamed protein product, partial [Tilletia laevis]
TEHDSSVEIFIVPFCNRGNLLKHVRTEAGKRSLLARSPRLSRAGTLNSVELLFGLDILVAARILITTLPRGPNRHFHEPSGVHKPPKFQGSSRLSSVNHGWLCRCSMLARPDLLITVFEASVSPGGGCSLGGQLMRLNALNLRKLKHMGAPDMNNSKTLVTSNTREVFAGMICGGMELAELDGLPRMDASSTASSEQGLCFLRPLLSMLTVTALSLRIVADL